jgi:ribosome biogenesis GTPase A
MIKKIFTKNNEFIRNFAIRKKRLTSYKELKKAESLENIKYIRNKTIIYEEERKNKLKELPIDKKIMNQIERVYAGKRKGNDHINALKNKVIEPYIKTLFNRKSCQYVASAETIESVPKTKRIEIAFAGRSNVGKSSLLNAVTKGGKARVSNKPGMTRTLSK